MPTSAPFARLLAALACTSAGLAAAAPEPVPDTLAQRIAPCIACHAPKDPRTAQANGSYFPRIGGKPAGYLVNQLVNFREGRRQYPLMNYMVAHLSDDYLREIADWFATSHTPPPEPAPVVAPALLERGRQLVMHGDKRLKVPACVACHGERLTGVAPAIPGLVGLPRDYLNAQFGAWRNGTRRAHAPDCMNQIAQRLSLADVSAVSGWLASQPLPADPRPANSIARPLPLACGSAPD